MNPFFTKWNSVKTKENGVTNSDLIPQKGLLKQIFISCLLNRNMTTLLHNMLINPNSITLLLPTHCGYYP